MKGAVTGVVVGVDVDSGGGDRRGDGVGGADCGRYV